MRIGCDSPLADIYPVFIYATKQISESNMLWFQKGWRGIIDCDILLYRSNINRIAKINILAIKQHTLYLHGGRKRIARNIIRIDQRHTRGRTHFETPATA